MYMLFNDQLLTSSDGSRFYDDDISYDYIETDTYGMKNVSQNKNVFIYRQLSLTRPLLTVCDW